MAELVNTFKLRKIDFSLHILGMSLLIVSIYSIWSTSYNIKDSGLSFGKISSCQGSCKYRTPEDYFWLDARGNQAVVDKSLVFTPGQSMASVLLNSGSRLTLYPNSLVQITSTKKGASIDIIEGKVNFEKNANSNSVEKLSVKGKEVDVDQTPIAELSAIPESLKVSAPDSLMLSQSSVDLNLNIANGKSPFQITIEDEGEEKTIVSEKNNLLVKLSKSGIYSLKIKDAAGEIASRFVTVEDMRVPVITSPRNGDIVYSKNFQPLGSFDSENTEFKIISGESDVYLGSLNQLPKNLADKEYTLSARIKRGQNVSEWSPPIQFQVVQTKLPKLIQSNDTLFFTKASLSWKRTIPALHRIVIRPQNDLEILNITTNSDSYTFSSKNSGKFQWMVEPLFIDANEKSSWQTFQLVNPEEFLLGPEDESVLLSEDLDKNVAFRWKGISSNDLKLQLEIKGKDFRKKIDVTGLNDYELTLPVLRNYKWKMVFLYRDQTYETPEVSFTVDAPPPVEPIKNNEIIIKD